MRRQSALANDYDTAYEVFVGDFYRPALSLPSDQVQNIVDLGANVGYATMYFAHVFPKAHVHCFEPHPRSFGALVDNLRRNNLMERVTLYQAAASSATMLQFLTDNRTCSTVVSESGDRTFRIMQLDLFDCLRGLRIDIFKMDIEGGEYSILGDDRFRQFSPAQIMMEWHSDQEHGDGKTWCVRRLEDLGYSVTIRFDRGHCGMLAAVRSKDSLDASLS